jgi:hypothetical protein
MPNRDDSIYPYGATQHSIHVAALLEAAGHTVQFLTYQRNERLRTPILSPGRVLDRYPKLSLEFNFSMASHHISESLQRGLLELAKEQRTGHLLYLQTSVLLPYFPANIPTIVTHHSPFVDDVTRAMGHSSARQAFDWDHPKADFLRQAQSIALETLLQRDHIQCAEISPLQIAYLARQGVSPKRLHSLPPPVSSEFLRPESIPSFISTFLDSRPQQAPIAITAVSRLDHFKNVDL